MTARTSENFKIAVACTVLCEFIVFSTQSYVMRVVAFVAVIAILANGGYSNTIFAVLICFICIYVSVLVFMIGAYVRFFDVRNNLLIPHLECVVVIAILFASFVYIIVIAGTNQTAGTAYVCFNIVENSGFIGVGVTGYMAVCTIARFVAYSISARTAIDTNIAVACTILGEVVFFKRDRDVRSAVIYSCTTTTGTGSGYSYTALAVLFCAEYPCVYIGVLGLRFNSFCADDNNTVDRIVGVGDCLNGTTVQNSFFVSGLSNSSTIYASVNRLTRYLIYTALFPRAGNRYGTSGNLTAIVAGVYAAGASACDAERCIIYILD